MCYNSKINTKALKAEYIDPDTGNLVKSNIGTPQGNVLTTLLANINLNELDKFMADLKIRFNKDK